MEGLSERIICDPKICSGKPCIKGTRIPLHIISGLMAAGEDKEGIKKAYPHITDDDVKACLYYAAILADEEAGVAVYGQSAEDLMKDYPFLTVEDVKASFLYASRVLSMEEIVFV